MTALLLLVSIFGYQKFQNSKLVKNAEQEFFSFSQNHFVTEEEPRPTGGFQLGIIGQVRGAPDKETLESRTPQLEQAVKRNPNNSKLNHYLGTIFFFRGDLSKAETYYLQALSLDEKNAKIYNDLALIDIKRKQFPKALQHLQQAINLNPSLLEARYNLAVVYELSDHKEQAIEAWKIYLQLDPEPDSVWKSVAKGHLNDLNAE